MYRVIVCFVCFNVWAVFAHAQQTSRDLLQQSDRMRTLTQAEQQSYTRQGIPELYEGELDDLGPQLLLLEAIKRQPWQFLFDLQVYNTKNVSLTETNETSSNVFVWTTQLAYLLNKREFQGWEVQPTLGARYQLFRYGMINADDRPIAPGTTAVDSLDFDSRSLYGDLVFTRGMWRVGFSLTYTSLISAHATEGNFYYEWLPSLSIGRAYQWGERDVFFVAWDTSYHISETPGNAVFTLDEGIADAVDTSLSLIHTHSLTPQWNIQPSLRLQRSYYTATGRDRQDTLATATLTTNYMIHERFSLRAFTSYEMRDSTETTTADYQNANVGLGFSGVFKY